MDEHGLPTRRDLFAHASGELLDAGDAITRATAWLQSDWRPAGTELTADEARVQGEAMQLCGQAGSLLSRAYDAVGQVVDG
jgi:hypothetical protein